MDTRQAYNLWASQYDTNQNKTRDLEAVALRTTLAPLSFDSCLEIGCGTGKNTQWLVQQARHVTAVDFSEQMLARAQEKIVSDRVEFIQADITSNWSFRQKTYDLVGFSLVLEHLQNLDPLFKEAALALNPGGHVYVGELHPFKQYSGTKARFDTAAGQHIVPCFTHHISDFLHAAKNHGLALADLHEFFDPDKEYGIPRIMTLLLQKP